MKRFWSTYDTNKEYDLKGVVKLMFLCICLWEEGHNPFTIMSWLKDVVAEDETSTSEMQKIL
eukprot:4705432-Karenia_brevis.AAC.1